MIGRLDSVAALSIARAVAVQADTAGILDAYWRRIGLPPAPHALSWAKKEVPKDWQGVAGWHGDVLSKGGIVAMTEEEEEALRAEFERAAEAAPKLRRYLERHRPFYDKAKALALRADGASTDDTLS